MSRHWRLILLCVVVSAAALAAACAPSPQATPTPGVAPSEEPKYGGALRVVHSGGRTSAGAIIDPPGWDPHKSAAAGTQYALNMVHSKLLQFPKGPQVKASDYSLVGDLAKNWEYTTPTRLVMRLHEGVRFHDRPPVNGRELTSEDVKFTFERLKKVATFTAYLYEEVQAIDTPDKYTVVFNLRAPDSGLLMAFASHFTSIIAKEAGGPEQDWTKKETAIGSGPWMLKETVVGSYHRCVRNPTYFRKDLPYADEVYMPIIQDDSARLAAFRAGQLDIMYGLE